MMPEPKRPGALTTMQDVELMYKNFTGAEDRYNEAGRRNFAVVIPPEDVEHMQSLGWHLRRNDAKMKVGDEWVIDPDGEPKYTLKINIAFTGFRPPTIVMITQKGKRPLCQKRADDTINPNEINVIQWANISKTDLAFRPYEYEPGKFSAWLTSLYVTLELDELAEMYEDVPDAGSGESHDDPYRGEI
jgi:hypothetical protein